VTTRRFASIFTAEELSQVRFLLAFDDDDDDDDNDLPKGCAYYGMLQPKGP
jgi:hypothetical protein